MHHIGVLQLVFAKWRYETIREVVCQFAPFASFVPARLSGSIPQHETRRFG